MILYEVRVGKCKPFVFDDANVALKNALAFKNAGKRASVFELTYNDGVGCGAKRVGVAKYGALAKRLAHMLKKYKYARARLVRECRGRVEESEATEIVATTKDGVSVLATRLTLFSPWTDLIIDDYGYVPNFYDAFWFLRIYATNDIVGAWDLAYETPKAAPQPHVMDC